MNATEPTNKPARSRFGRSSVLELAEGRFLFLAGKLDAAIGERWPFGLMDESSFRWTRLTAL